MGCQVAELQDSCLAMKELEGRGNSAGDLDLVTAQNPRHWLTTEHAQTARQGVN